MDQGEKIKDERFELLEPIPEESEYKNSQSFDFEYSDDVNLQPIELLDHDYCMKNPPKSEESEDFFYGPPKPENAGYVEPKLEEPDYLNVSNFILESPKYLKTEPVGIYSSSNQISERKQRNIKCSVCLKTVNQRKITHLSSKNRQLPLLVSLISKGMITVEKAQALNCCNRFVACKEHLSEALDEILRILKIKNLREPWTDENMETLMETVRKLHPVQESYQIIQLLVTFNRKVFLMSQDRIIHTPRSTYFE